MFLLWLREVPRCGDWTHASVPPPAKGRSRPTITPAFSHSSLVLLSFPWVFIFFSPGHILLSVLNWCSACTSVSEGIFLMYPWREMYSTFTYFSAILFTEADFLLSELQGTLKSLLQYHSLKASVLQHSAFFIVQFHIHKWLLEKSYLWLDGPLLAKQYLCFLICCLGWP